MNKSQLIEHIAHNADLSKHGAGRALDAMQAAITQTLKKNGEVTITGFGKFSVIKRAARTGRNPRTGETLRIKASKAPKFTPGKALKDALN